VVQKETVLIMKLVKLPMKKRKRLKQEKKSESEQQCGEQFALRRLCVFIDLVAFL
jgi:hypothetical protein